MRASTLLLLSALLGAAPADEGGWTDLTNLDAWKPPTGDWAVVGEARVNPKNPKRLVGEPGTGVLFNGPAGRTGNIASRESFGDVEVHAEFLVPRGSNSGIKFQGVYEVQIYDSYGKTKVSGDDCGGIYPRAEMLPRYHHIDEGHAPRVNACKPPGEWQSLDITFRAPRFGADGKKTASARFVKVVLNGQVVQDDVAADTPTGHIWRDAEHSSGPLLLQADHGPVAFRNLRARPLPSGER